MEITLSFFHKDKLLTTIKYPSVDVGSQVVTLVTIGGWQFEGKHYLSESHFATSLDPLHVRVNLITLEEENAQLQQKSGEFKDLLERMKPPFQRKVTH